MSAPNKLKRKRECIDNERDSTAPDPKRRKLDYTQDKPLRYLLLFTHTLIANYEEIIKESWIRSIQYIIRKTNKQQQQAEDTRLIACITQFIHDVTVSTFVEDDFVETLFKCITMYQSKCNTHTLIINNNLKYDIMQIKDKFFADSMYRIQLRKGMRIFLRELKENLKWTLCLIHKDSRETYNLILNDIGLRGYFNAFVCAPSIANYSRPYVQLYEQSISRSRIFKQQCIVVTNYEIEALESIHFGLYPILISKQNITLDGKYFLLKHNNNWINDIFNLLRNLKQTQQSIDSLEVLIHNDKCLQSKGKINFLNEDGKIYCGTIDKLIISFPVQIFRIHYLDDEKNKQTCLKQSYLLWGLE